MENLALGNGHSLSIPLELGKLKKLQMLIQEAIEEFNF
jgi:hypothetical protein